MLGLGNYNYGHFSRELFHDLARSSFSGPGPGARKRPTSRPRPWMVKLSA